MEKTLLVLFSVVCVSLICLSLSFSPVSAYGRRPLRFNPDGRFKILQVSDMHYGLGKESQCSDVSPAERPYCSDLNTTAFLHRTITSEKPDLIVFSGTNFVREKKNFILCVGIFFFFHKESRCHHNKNRKKRNLVL